MSSRLTVLVGTALVATALAALLAALVLGASSAQAQSAGSAAFFGESTDTIQVSGQTVIGTTSTYEAVISFPTSGASGLLFNEWTWGEEDKMLGAGFSDITGYNYPNVLRVLVGSVTLSPNVWHHVAFVYDGSQEHIYLDGTLVASRAASGEVGDASGLAHIGAIFRDGSINSGFVGYMDSLRISNVARYSGQSFTPPSGDLASDANTQLLYNFNDAEGSPTVQDSSPNGRTGTLGAGFTGATSPQLGATAPQDDDTTSPRVTGTEPTKKATGVARDVSLTATFSEAMDRDTITRSTFKLFKVTSDGTTKRIFNTTVTLSTDDLKATLDPFGASDTLLRANTRYKAVVTTGAKDLAGNRLDQNSTSTGNQRKVWTFTTGGS